MSTDINNFLQTMVEAKAAIEAQPEMRKRIAELERHTHIQGETIANRELHIHNLKGTVTELTQKLRSVEAERDDAGFRTLEAEDKVQGLLIRLNRIVTDSLETIAAVSGGATLVVVPETDRQELTQLRQDTQTYHEEVVYLKGVQSDIIAQRDQFMYENAQLKADLAQAKQDQYRPFVEQPSIDGTMDSGTSPSTTSATHSNYLGSAVEPKDDSGLASAGFSVEPDPTTSTMTASIHSTATQGSTTNTPTATSATERDTASTMGQSEADPTSPSGPIGPLPVSTQPEAHSSGTEASQEYTSAMEAKRASEEEFHTKLGVHPAKDDDFWPIPSRASHSS